MKDHLGLELTGADGTALPPYQRALAGLQCFAGDPVSAVEEAIAARPDFVMAHVLKGYLYALSTEASAAAIARQTAAAASLLPATTREARHVAAACRAEQRPVATRRDGCCPT